MTEALARPDETQCMGLVLAKVVVVALIGNSCCIVAEQCKLHIHSFLQWLDIVAASCHTMTMTLLCSVLSVVPTSKSFLFF